MPVLYPERPLPATEKRLSRVRMALIVGVLLSLVASAFGINWYVSTYHPEQWKAGIEYCRKNMCP